MLRQALSPEAARDVAGTWAFRARGEREAHARFKRLAASLFSSGATDLVVRMASDAAEDEARHAVICKRIAAEWGMPTAATPQPAPAIGSRSLPPHERVLVEVVSLCCIAETVATSVLGASLETVAVPDLRDALHEILKDEVKHARLGWAHLAEARRKGHGDGLSAHLPTLLEEGVPAAMFEAFPSHEARPELGTLDDARRKGLVRTALVEVAFPGFEHLGVDAGPARAWLAGRVDLA